MHTTHSTNDSPLRSVIQGGLPLWKAFWLLYVGGHVLLAVGIVQVVRIAISTDLLEFSAELISWRTLTSALGLITALFLAYFVLCCTAVWRSSHHHANPMECWGARAILIVHGMWWVLKLLALGLYATELHMDVLQWLGESDAAVK